LVGNDPSRLWKVWDAFGIGDARMNRVLGRWLPGPDGRPGRGRDSFPEEGESDDLHRQLGQGSGQSPAEDRLESAGNRPKTAKLRAPEIPDFQFAAEFNPGDPIPSKW